MELIIRKDDFLELLNFKNVKTVFPKNPKYWSNFYVSSIKTNISKSTFEILKSFDNVEMFFIYDTNKGAEKYGWYKIHRIQRNSTYKDSYDVMIIGEFTEAKLKYNSIELESKKLKRKIKLSKI
jgi:hypothetical protein